jgi:uncharacterized protein
MIFEIIGKTLEGKERTFHYDNCNNALSDTEGNVYKDQTTKPYTDMQSISFSKDEPLVGKSVNVSTVKIQLGLSCNYNCSYCSQRFVAHAPETNKNDIDGFLEKLDNLLIGDNTKFEFWGGEPLVYWDTLKLLAEKIDKKYRHKLEGIKFSTITNGSLLTEEICDWFYNMGFSIAISHDGPGQRVRGDDPFDNPEKRKLILDFYRKMKNENRISFSAMLNSTNYSRKVVYDWFVDLTGDIDVTLSEGSIIDTYNEGGVANTLSGNHEHFNFRKTAFNDIRETCGDIGFFGHTQKINNFTHDVLAQTSADNMGMKCGMDRKDVIALDLRGDVITCQNISAVEIALNGESHHCGNIENLGDIQITTATHWSNRPNCSNCPVLRLCKGSCMILDGEMWDVTCNSSYSDNISLFAISFEVITGYIPVLINADHLPDDRKDIWGTILNHP